ncbi:GNAT family N-acetyltransferase [Advenella sp. FME57]|uniref:GNAT family N-acetyltransferase n=1 Tax=Advenella sp. FME57 TaxID=2742604 RepID=UPI001D011170|nr:GNAT family N-acetyltransferase [Advenella sp. FME57]
MLLADPSEDKIRSYLHQSQCFVASHDGIAIGACLVQALAPTSREIKSIAVHPDHQKAGTGTLLLKWIIGFYRRSGVIQLEVGTGSFGYQLAFYQKQGFRVTGIERNFFIDNYNEPIVEDGIRLYDMLRLTLRLDRTNGQMTAIS